MLVLTRRVGESLFFTFEGKEIEIKVLGGTRRDRTRLGVIAPDDVKILRNEVKERIDAQARNNKGGTSGADAS